MDKKAFGLLVATLRKELRNEFDETLTQYDLAELARISQISLQKIEQGRSVNVPSEVLLNLAKALNLPSRAMRVFFLASFGIKERDYIKKVITPQAVLEGLKSTLVQMQIPAFITDAFGNVIVLNPAMLEVYDITEDQYGDPRMLSQYNIIRFLFSPEFEKQRIMLSESLHYYTHRMIMLFKMMTLKYRNHGFFRRLLPELNRYPLFREHWQSPNFHNEDIFNLNNSFFLEHPRHGLLRFISCAQPTMTVCGDLYFYNFMPMDTRTAETCLRIVRKVGTQPILFSAWPKPEAVAHPL